MYRFDSSYPLRHCDRQWIPVTQVDLGMVLDKRDGLVVSVLLRAAHLRQSIEFGQKSYTPGSRLSQAWPLRRYKRALVCAFISVIVNLVDNCRSVLAATLAARPLDGWMRAANIFIASRISGKQSCRMMIDATSKQSTPCRNSDIIADNSAHSG